MRKGRSIIGLKVLSQMDAANVGSVKDLIFDHETNELLALLISDKELFGFIDAKIVPWNQVRTIGPDAVMVASEDSKINAGDDVRVRDVMERQTALSGTKIYTTDGQDLGTLADMYIDEETGHVVGYEVSGGFFSDTLGGKSFMPAPPEISIGRDAALVPPEVATDLEAQRAAEPGGLKAVASNVGSKVSDTYSNIAAASVEKQKQFVVGKVAGRDVIIPVNKVATTSATAATSETSGTIDPVATPASASLSSSEALLPTATETTYSTPSEVALTTPTMPPLSSESVGALSSTELQTQPSHVTSSGEIVDGEVLVHKGETITAEHADRAEAAGVLGQLVLAAGGGVAGGALAAGQEKVSGSTAGLQGNVGEHATGVWETIKEKVADLTGAAHDKKAQYDSQAEQNRINNALGRPTTRVILDQNDNIILNTGDLITHAAVESARQAGVLSILLDSVYTADPEITPEMLRASEPGQAALPTQAQPSGGPITATVAPDVPSQDTPSQGTTTM